MQSISSMTQFDYDIFKYQTNLSFILSILLKYLLTVFGIVDLQILPFT